jgi:integrase/recombinase XerD
MNDAPSLGVWVRRLLLEHLVGERNLARNTQRSYRDTLVLLLPFVAAKLNKALDQLTPTDLSAEVVRLFLTHLEESRQSSSATRNQRSTALHALARFVGGRSPEHIDWCGQIRAIPFKKTTQVVIP